MPLIIVDILQIVFEHAILMSHAFLYREEHLLCYHGHNGTAQSDPSSNWIDDSSFLLSPRT